MYNKNNTLASFDPELFHAIQQEAQRQEDHVELIASENYVSPAVLAAQGSLLTNKYAEGYPGKRYYGGCEYVDIIENLAISRAKQLFGADFANVQPHSGSQANAAAYLACINTGDTIMGMNLAAGGHLSHGAKVSFSGRIYNAVSYGLDPETGMLNYQDIQQLAEKYRPKLIVAGFSAYSRIIDWQQFRKIADSIGAILVVDIAHVAGLVATGLYPSPVQIADITTSTTHKTLRGPRSGLILAKDNPELTKKINAAVFPGLQGGPLCHIIAAKAVAFREALTPEFKEYQQQILRNAQAMVEVIKARGYTIVSNGTDNHLFLLNLLPQKLTGQEALEALAAANITVNKNAIPNDPQPPSITSGLRIGTPAITTRGFKEAEAQQIATWICDILDDPQNNTLTAKIKAEVLALCRKFPVYAE